jgi:hypothetical protein
LNISHSLSYLRSNLSNLPGWRTNRKMVVIESDDWGSIRMPSTNTFNILADAGLDLTGMDSGRYNLNDTLASAEDLATLFEILSKHRDQYNRTAVITAVSVVANPDFEKIKDDHFRNYYFEPFTKTLERYYGGDSVFNLWKQGMAHQLFKPQFHAREHLNVAEWMRALQSGDKETMLAFDQGCWGFNNKNISGSRISYQAAFDLYHAADMAIQATAIKDGLDLFEKIFGYRASYFVPPNGPFNNQLQKIAADGGIKYMYADRVQTEPQGLGKSKKRFHWLGLKNQYQQAYITRNCFFEPGIKNKDWVSSCLNNIATAFRWHKPAVISTHRVNYTGALFPANSENGLKKLNELLKTLLQKWPGAEFYTSDELGNMILNSEKQ